MHIARHSSGRELERTTFNNELFQILKYSFWHLTSECAKEYTLHRVFTLPDCYGKEVTINQQKAGYYAHWYPKVQFLKIKKLHNTFILSCNYQRHKLVYPQDHTFFKNPDAYCLPLQSSYYPFPSWQWPWWLLKIRYWWKSRLASGSLNPDYHGC